MKTVYLSLGSNLGDRWSNLREAIDRLGSADLRVLRASSVYETEPRDLLDQPWFLNQVIEIETSLFPRQLLARVQKIERVMGRRRTIPKGPRTIDVDILLFGDAVIKTPDLEIPHPRLHERRFVLEPLAELAPELRHPLLKQPLRELRQTVAEQVLRIFRSPCP